MFYTTHGLSSRHKLTRTLSRSAQTNRADGSWKQKQGKFRNVEICFFFYHYYVKCENLINFLLKFVCYLELWIVPLLTANTQGLYSQRFLEFFSELHLSLRKILS